MKYLNILFILPFLLMGCDSSEDDSEFVDHELLENFYTNASSLKVEVAYEQGAEPFVNAGFGGSDNFDFTSNNIADLVSGRSNAISVSCDKTLNEMTVIPNQNKSSYTSLEIREFPKFYQETPSTENQGVVFLVFLDGYYNYEGQVQTNVLGVSTGSFTVALFKPAIDAISGGIFGSSAKYIAEQATVVHEVGHALGLVDNGVAQHMDHLDEAHGKHCDNQNCVMYWAIEGASGASGMFGSGSTTELVFGAECKADITNF